MLDDISSSRGSIACPRGVVSFIVPSVPTRSDLWQPRQQERRWQQEQRQLKSKRKHLSRNGSNTNHSDPWHVNPPPRLGSAPCASSSVPHEPVTVQHARSGVRRPASRVGSVSTSGSTSRSRASLSSAAPQTVADPAVEIQWNAEELARQVGGDSNLRPADVGEIGVEVTSSTRDGSDVFNDVGDGAAGGDRSSCVRAHADSMPHVRELEFQHYNREQQVDIAGHEEEQEEDGAERRCVGQEAGVDDYSRQLIGRLTKLARSGLWKASFKVLRVEQALNTRKAAAARDKGEEYSMAWPVIEQKAYNTILSALSRAGRWEEAVLLLKEMETREIRRDAVSYACVIAACGRGMQWKKALSSLCEMKDLGIKPNSFVYSAAIDACAKGRQWQKALLLLREMEVVDGLPANLICYNAAADACGKAGRPGEALALLAKMRKVGIRPNEVSYLSVISACSRVGDWQQAIWMLDEMAVFGVQPGLKCYCSAITACGKGGKWEQALELLDVMHDEGPPPNDYCYNAAISACGKSGEWERSKELLDVMRQRGVAPDLISYNAAIDACGKGGRWEEGLKLFVDMVKASEEPWDPEMGHPKPPTPDATTYGAAITACSRGGEWRMALRFLEDMEKKGVERTEGVFQATLAGCARVGRWRECIVTLDQMRKAGVRPRVAAYNSVITACGRGGEWRRAIAVLLQMSSRGATPDVITLNAVMTACAQSKRWKQAKLILDFMRDPTTVPTTELGGLSFPILTGGTGASGDAGGAGGSAGGAEAAPTSASDISVAFETLGAEARSRTVAVAVSGGVAVDTPAAAVADRHGSGLGERRRKGQGAPWQQRRTTGNGLWPPRPDAFSFHTVIKALASAGMWEDAVDLLGEMADERRRFLRSDEGFLESTVGGAQGAAGGAQQQWPVNVDRFRDVFQLELKNNEIVGHEREGGWSQFSLSPEVSLRAKAMDMLIIVEREEKEARLKRQMLYETIAGR